jgi:hypothetical protein
MVVPSHRNHVQSPVQWLMLIMVYSMVVNRSGREADRSLPAVETLKRTTHLQPPTLRIPVSLPN